MKSNPPALSALGRRTAAPPISWLMQLTLSKPRLISLAAGFTDAASLPLGGIRRLLAQTLSPQTAGRAALQYGSTQGDPALRRWTARYLGEQDGPGETRRNAPPERMLITGGSQQLLYLTTEALCDDGDIVLVEDPTYFVFLSILQSRGLRARSVRMQPDGLDLSHLEEVLESLRRRGELRRVKFLYLVSYFQNPTGITTVFEKKRRALELLRRYERAAGHPLYLVEDAAYRELRFAGADVKSALSAKGAAERVIYAGTYSKPFATGIRVGFGILPEPVFTAVLRIKGNHDFGTSNLLQQLLLRAVESGQYERHVVALRRAYGRKAAVMRAALRREFPVGVDWPEPEGGLYFWARLPARLRSGATSRLFRTALAKNVLYVPGMLCYADDPFRRKPDHEMRISFGNATAPEIREGVARLGRALRICWR